MSTGGVRNHHAGKCTILQHLTCKVLAFRLISSIVINEQDYLTTGLFNNLTDVMLFTGSLIATQSVNQMYCTVNQIS